MGPRAVIRRALAAAALGGRLALVPARLPAAPFLGRLAPPG
jgi:hypothetical protein